MTVILAILQNAWSSQPEEMQELYDWFESTGSHCARRRHIRRSLFYRCLTGKRIRKAFGEDLCRTIEFENASKVITSKASESPKGDSEHVAKTILEVKPDVILVFGAIAKDTVAEAMLQLPPDYRQEIALIHGPHPANRRADTNLRLEKMSELLETKYTDPGVKQNGENQ